MVFSSEVPTEAPSCWPTVTVADADSRVLRCHAERAGVDRRRDHHADADSGQDERAEHARGIAGVRAQLGQPGRPARRGQHPGRDQRPGPDPGHQHDRGQVGREDEAGADRQERHAGDERRVAQRLLQVVGQEQEGPEQPGRGDEHRQVGAAPVAVEHHARRQQRVGGPALPGPRTPRRAPRRRPGTRRWTAWPSCARPRWRTRRPGRTRRRRPAARPGCPASAGPGTAGASAAAHPPANATPAKIRFTYSVHRQDRYSVSTPPSSRPTAPPAPAIAP